MSGPEGVRAHVCVSTFSRSVKAQKSWVRQGQDKQDVLFPSTVTKETAYITQDTPGQWLCRARPTGDSEKLTPKRSPAVPLLLNLQ